MTVMAMAGTLSTQPDRILNCRKRASVLINATLANTIAQRRGAFANGDDLILWKATLSSSHAVSGFCEARPQTGVIVRLGTDQADINRKYKITRDEAERICQREARARFSPGDGLLGAVSQSSSPIGSTYTVDWRYLNLAGTIRRGRCTIDSHTGQIRDFEVSLRSR
jgi:hypothetical protein